MLVVRHSAGWARGRASVVDMPQEPRAGRDLLDDDPIVVLARREGWVLTTAELRGVGCDRSRQSRLGKRGWLTQIFRGVHLVGRSKPTRDELERAAVKACGEGAVLSHRSAAVRWGLLRRYDGPVEVTAPTRRARRARLRPYEGNLDPRDVTTKDGVAVTTLARTLVDLAAILTPEQLEVAVHEAENLRRLRIRAVDAAIERAGRRQPGRPALRRCLAARRPNAGGLKFELEKKFHRFLHRHGFPPCEHNVLFELDDHDVTELDAFFRGAGVGVELDGGPHQTTRGFHKDRRKDRRMEAVHRVTILRVTHRDLDEGEAELAADLWAVLVARSS